MGGWWWWVGGGGGGRWVMVVSGCGWLMVVVGGEVGAWLLLWVLVVADGG